jgi:serine/threonine protein kinase
MIGSDGHECPCIKDNIVISPEGRALLCDFGSSRTLLASRSLAQMSSGLKGTINYLAPELIDESNPHAQYSKQTDVWAFSMTVYVRVYGHILFLSTAHPKK